MNNLVLITKIFFWITFSVGLCFFILYSFDWLNFFNSLRKKQNLSNYSPKKLRSFAIVIPARDESNVVKDLITSIQKQKYDGLIDIYLVADNCTDNRATYNIGKQLGVNVLERFNNINRGGNFAIQHALRYIRDNNLLDKYDCYCSFDADNLLDENWVSEVNKTYDYYECNVVTSYRNSINFKDNWISSSYAIQFIKESDINNKSRSLFNAPQYINGTGFSFTREILQQTNFWDFNSLSHDIEFSQWLLINNIKTNYAENAIFYDEQPIVYKDSIKQRTRWSVGFNQVFKMYGGSVFCSLFKPKRSKFSAYSNYLMIFPAIITFLTNILLYLITSGLYLASFLLIKNNGLEHVYSEFNLANTLIYILTTPLIILFTIWINLFLQGIFVVVKNKKRIKANKWQKFISILAYPTFMLTYIPISLKALFIKKFSTKPIQRKTR